MPGRALALGPISLTLADSSWRRAGSTWKVVTRAYMGVPLLRHCSHAGRGSHFARAQTTAGRAVALRSLDMRGPPRVVSRGRGERGADQACFQLRRMW